MKKSPVKSVLALLLCAALLLPISSTTAAAKSPAKLRIALLSDIHFFPPELAGGYNAAFKENNIIGQPVEQVPGILRSALAAIKARNEREKIDYLLLTGDLTNTGEYLSHVRLAEILMAFEQETGISVAVVPGNHDIDYGSREFTTGVRRDIRKTFPKDFPGIYATLGYDLPGLARFKPKGDVQEGELSYAVDLGSNYRLIAIDTWRRRVSPELREWVVKQCRAAVKAGKIVIGMGHHNLNEQFQGQMTVMQNEGLENMRELSEEFAGAGMHFYFSGHLHMSEISPWTSDSGEMLYDIIVPGLWDFPGDYRVVDFAAEGRKITADVRSYATDEVLPVKANGITYPQPYVATSLKLTFGYEGEGLAGFVKANAQKGLGGQLRDMNIAGMADLGPLNLLLEYLDNQLSKNTQNIINLVNNLVDEAFALPVSKLPCTRFMDELGFGGIKKRGTLEDAGNSLVTYMFWKKHDPKEDPFIQDVLRRIKNGELIAQVLDFAIPKVLEVLGAEIVPLLANVDIGMVNRAMACGVRTLSWPLLLVLALLPGTRDTISKTLYDFVSGAITSQSPSGRGTDAKLVYSGPMDAPTGPKTFRLPYGLSVTLGGVLKSTEITWYTKSSLISPEVRLTDMAGNAVQGVAIEYSSEPEKITVNQIDLGITQMMGYSVQVMKHTAKISGLKPLNLYSFTAGDSKFGWYSAPQRLAPTDTPVKDFAVGTRDWVVGELKLPVILWNNRGF